MNIVRNRVGLAAVTLVVAIAAAAQAPGIKRTLLQRADLGDGREAILGAAEISSGGSTGRHTHFGLETGYVLEGTLTLEIEGEPTKQLKAGESYQIPLGRVHNGSAANGTAKILATYIVDKGKPLATPAP